MPSFDEKLKSLESIPCEMVTIMKEFIPEDKWPEFKRHFLGKYDKATGHFPSLSSNQVLHKFIDVLKR